jgi:hypothetical protein
MLLMAGIGAVQLSLLDHRTSTVVTGSFNFSSVDCGAGGDVVLAAEAFTANTFSTLTIGGVTATQEVIASAASGSRVAIYTATGVPSGLQSVIFTITGGGVSTRTAIQLYSIEGHASLVPTTTATDINHATSEQSASLTFPAGSAVLAAAMQNTGNSTAQTWSGVPTDVSDQASLATFTTGSDYFPGGGSSYSITTDFNGTIVAGAAAWAAWAPP